MVPPLGTPHLLLSPNQVCRCLIGQSLGDSRWNNRHYKSNETLGRTSVLPGGVCSTHTWGWKERTQVSCTVTLEQALVVTQLSSSSPTQTFPSAVSSWPGGQMHSKLPSVFMQIPPRHSSGSRSHSLISAENGVKCGGLPFSWAVWITGWGVLCPAPQSQHQDRSQNRGTSQNKQGNESRAWVSPVRFGKSQFSPLTSAEHKA